MQVIRRKAKELQRNQRSKMKGKMILYVSYVRRNIDWWIVKNSKWNQSRTELILPPKTKSVKIVYRKLICWNIVSVLWNVVLTAAVKSITPSCISKANIKQLLILQRRKTSQSQINSPHFYKKYMLQWYTVQTQQ